MLIKVSIKIVNLWLLRLKEYNPVLYFGICLQHMLLIFLCTMIAIHLDTKLGEITEMPTYVLS